MSKLDQMKDNIAALDVRLSEAHLAELNKVSEPTQKMRYSLFTPTLRQHVVFGGKPVSAWTD